MQPGQQVQLPVNRDGQSARSTQRSPATAEGPLSFADPAAAGRLIAIPLLIVWYLGASEVEHGIAPRSCCPRLPRRSRPTARDGAATFRCSRLRSHCGADRRAGRAAGHPRRADPQARSCSSSTTAVRWPPPTCRPAPGCGAARGAELSCDRARQRLVGVIVFNQTPTVLSPPTTDHAGRGPRADRLARRRPHGDR